MLVIADKIAIKAADVDRVGKYANWLARVSGGGRVVREGNKNLCTTRRSRVLDKIGSTDIGLMSDGTAGLVTLGMGCIIIALFHWSGMVDVDRESEKR